MKVSLDIGNLEAENAMIKNATCTVPQLQVQFVLHFNAVTKLEILYSQTA